ncbi:U3 small nucleolar RNA-associated protein 10 [Corynespora cassiicola Philippines]|uniref:U3 small nucleolar RNA-associated protein 10 n=1 Tax=Corynespora cassiicola Philippines TaxID=1448308 RepID=A0A2T2P9H2_CORCC|nr:U3 small nucleolar RNA-associated protein 10 [Corynespora cassiicola Philippines]
MTSLQKQLAVIAASSTHQLDLKAQKAAHGKSLLFEPRVAASQSFDNIYLICYEGYRDLCALDPRFTQFSRSLFSEQSKVEDRTQMTKKENEKLDAVLEAFITLVGPRLLLKPAEKALEWLVRRFRIHEYNTETLVLTYLPYHTTPQFLALLSILSPNPPHNLRFLAPYIKSPTNPPRSTIVYTAVNTPVFFNRLQEYMVKVLEAGHQGSTLLSFWSSVTTQAVDAILDQASSGRKDVQDQRIEETLLRVLPVLNNCMKLSNGAEAITACYMIIIVLVTKTSFEDKILDSLMEAAILNQDSETLDACLMCLAIVAEERSRVQLPTVVAKRVLRIPELTRILAGLSQKCRVERLALGCALGNLENMGTGPISDERLNAFKSIVQSALLSEHHISIALVGLVQLLQSSDPGSSKYGQLLDIASQLGESPVLGQLLERAAKAQSLDLQSLGVAVGQPLGLDETDDVQSEDEDMPDADDTSVPTIQPPKVTGSSFLDDVPLQTYQEMAAAFEQAVASNQASRFVGSDGLRRSEASDHPLYLSLLSRLWCSPIPVSSRVAAIRFATASIKKFGNGIDLQHILPYLLYALSDTSRIVRRAAAATVAALSEKPTSNSRVWGSSSLYGKKSSKICALQGEQTGILLSSVLGPILEECVMDCKFILTSLRSVLEGTQTRVQAKNALKAPVRSSLSAFLASHIALTPLLQVRLRLLPIFNAHTKSTASIRTTIILPVIREWFALSSKAASLKCEQEKIILATADQEHLAALVAREPESANLLKDIVGGHINKERTDSISVTFDRLNTLWPSLKSESRLELSQSLLEMALKEGGTALDEVCRTRSLEILRSVKLDSASLISFLESIPSAMQMPEGPPAKKRRRTSRNEMARVELQSPDDVSRLLRRLTLVLELVESSTPSEHPALFRNLFAILGELQPLKQQSGSDLVYLQSLILSSLTPIVNRLKGEKETTEYQSSVRADILIDCIRHSSSPQVQNSALLLIASLASWVPELILHNLMPIFTFIGSTLLRQKDDYSAHVVDQTISRVVPQLAASLRSKHKNFLTGVADLLLSFTAAFEHIPQHRRLKLFSELAQTLGPEDSLPAIIALLVDRYPMGTTQRRFSTDLLLAFDPLVTLETINGYLDLVTDAVGPKRKISDTLFSLNEKQPAQIESSLNSLVGAIADLAGEERVRNHVSKAFKRKLEPEQPRAIFASIAEKTIQLSKKVTDNRRLYESCSRVLGKSLDLLPTADLVKSAELLLENADSQVQVAAIKSVEIRAGSVIQNDHQSVSALLEFLPRVDAVLMRSQVMDVKIIAVSCIDRIIERFGKKDVSAVAAVAQTVAGPQALASADDRIRILSLLCLTSIVDVLEDEAIALLPTILPKSFQYLESAIAQENTGLHNAVYTLLSNIVERLGFMFSREYLVPVLKLSQRSAAAALDDACDESRSQFFESVSTHLEAQEVFNATKATWPDALSQGFDAAQEQLQLIRSTIETNTKSKLIKASSTLFGLLVNAFDFRGALNPNANDAFEDDEVEQLESSLIDSVIGMVLKLNDATFRPFFAQLVDQASSSPKSNQSRSITFFKFLEAFNEKFKSIVTNYSSYIVEYAVNILELLSKEGGDEELRRAVLRALQKAFQHDQDGFWQAPSHFGAIMPPLMKQLTIESEPEVTDDVIPAIVELAAASSSSIENHKEMNAVMLKYMVAEEAHTRLHTVKCEQALTKRLGEEWLGLLPEMLPRINELREDDDEMVERETQRWINDMGEILGEDLEAMLE